MTAERWARHLRGLGHRVTVETRYEGGRCDLVVALHARKSASSVLRARRDDPKRPIVLALTGTDAYQDLRRSARARRALAAADRIVVLQPLAAREIPRALRSRARVVYQSVREIPPRRTRPAGSAFVVAVA